MDAASDVGAWHFGRQRPPTKRTERSFSAVDATSPTRRQCSARCPLSNSEGSVLDPIVAIRCTVTIEPEETAVVDVVSGVGGDARDRPWRSSKSTTIGELADRLLDLAWTHGQVILQQLNATEAEAQNLRPLGQFDHLCQRPAPRQRQRVGKKRARANQVYGDTASPATCRSSCCESPIATRSNSCDKSSRPTPIGDSRDCRSIW